MLRHHSHHHGHFMTALIDWEHAHDEMVKASLVVVGIISMMILLGYAATKIDPSSRGLYQPMQYQYMPYY